MFEDNAFAAVADSDALALILECLEDMSCRVRTIGRPEDASWALAAAYDHGYAEAAHDLLAFVQSRIRSLSPDGA